MGEETKLEEQAEKEVADKHQVSADTHEVVEARAVWPTKRQKGEEEEHDEQCSQRLYDCTRDIDASKANE